MEGYSLGQVFIIFLIYAFLGWCLEVGFHLFKSRRFINRGFLQGPLCPIYGVGAILILTFLGHLSNSFWSIFLGGAIFASILELVTGYVLEKIFDTRWWDYSHKRFNIGGYISLDFTLIWGAVSVFMMEVLHPRVSRLVEGIAMDMVDPIAIFFFLIFSLDLFRTVRSLASFRFILRDISRMRSDWDERMEDRRANFENLLAERRQDSIEDMKMAEKDWEEQKEAYERKRLKKLKAINKRLESRHREFLNKYPAISSEEIRTKLRNLRKK